MNHLAIKHVLEEAERYTPEYSKQLGIRYEAIEQDGKQYEWPDSYMENQKLLARYGLFEDLNLDYDSEELEKAMEEADKRLERHGAATEARAIVSVIDSHRETFDLIAPPIARKLYEEFCLLAEPQPVAEPQQEPKETPRHYNNALPDEDLQTIFEMLKSNGYFGDDSDVKTWLYVCKGGNLDGDFQPLRWLKSGALLAVMCDTLFDNNRENIWEIAIICFKNKQMGYFKVRTLSQQLARHNNKVYSDIKGADKLLQLLKL